MFSFGMSARVEKINFLEAISNGSKINETGFIFPLPFTAYGWVLIFITLVSWLCNGAVLITFLKNRHLVTPFTVYLICLLACDLVQGAVMNPLDTIDSISTYFWMGTIACNVWQYTNYVIGGAIVHSHDMITVNRIWAVTFPHSYKQSHKKRFAVIAVVLMFMYIHVYCLPGLLLEALIYRLPLEISECVLNSASSWKVIAMIVIFDIPILVVVGAYPVLWWKRRGRLRVSSGVVPQKPASSTLSTRSSTSSEAFLTLTVTTFSLLICWAPMELYVTINSFTKARVPIFYNIAVLLYYIQPILDPLLFVLALKDLRQAVTLLVLCR